MTFEKIWAEDDVTVGCEGHETIFSAWRKLTGETLNKNKAKRKTIHDDSREYEFENGLVVILSYPPGNDEIWKRRNPVPDIMNQD